MKKKQSGKRLREQGIRGMMKDSSPLRYAYDMIWVYLNRCVPRAAAALSYYLIFTVFPVVILANAILGMMNLDPEAAFFQLEQYMPGDVAALVSEYLSYVNQNTSIALILASAFLILTSASAAFRLIVRASYDIYKIKSNISWVYYLLSGLMPLILVLVIYLSTLIMMTGSWFFRLVEKYTHITISLLHWEWMRFVLLFLILLAFLALVYRVVVPKLEERHPPVWPGAIAASVALVAISVGFSAIMDESNRYSIVYGSLASLIVLLLWLYVIGTVLIMGNALNYVIYSHRKAKDEGRPLEQL